MFKGNILIRADGGANMGAGHIMRCLALADALHGIGWRCCFISTPAPDAISRKIKHHGHALVVLDAPPGDRNDSEFCIAWLRENDGRAVIIDGYQFSAAYHLPFRQQRSLLTLALDDLGDRALAVDLVLNGWPHAMDLPYDSRAPGALHLLGPRYYPASPALLEHRAIPGEKVERLMITLGGGDNDAHLADLAQHLLDVVPNDLWVDLVRGPMTRAVGPALTGLPNNFHIHQDPADFQALMATADLAISGGGGTAAELAILGIPLVMAIMVDNQALNAKQAWCPTVDLRRHGNMAELATKIGALLDGPEERRNIAKQGQALFDGQGAQRVAQVIDDKLSRD